MLTPTALKTNPNTPDSPIHIAAVGNSLTEGFGVSEHDSYPTLLEQELKKAGFNCIVQNYGISGELSRETLARISGILSTGPDLLLLETGINDALHETPTATIRSNITAIVNHAIESEVGVILIAVEHIWSWDKQYITDFEELYREIAKQFSIPLIPSMLDNIAAVPSMTLADTIHPNQKGYQQVVKNMLPTVIKWFEDHSSGSSSSLPSKR